MSFLHPELTKTPVSAAAYHGARMRVTGVILISIVAVGLAATLRTSGAGNMAFALMLLIVPFSHAVERQHAGESDRGCPGRECRPFDAASGVVSWRAPCGTPCAPATLRSARAFRRMSTADTPPMRPRRQPDWRSLPPPSAGLEVCVIVPVRDEARRLPATLRALARQRDLDGSVLDPSRYEVIVLANNCSDASAEVVRCVAARHPRFALHVVEVRFPKALAHVGHARAALMNEACRRLRRRGRGPRDGRVGVIASTDGDTRVAPDWIAATLAEIESGADAVGGRIVTADDTAWPPGLERLARRDDAYQRLRSRLEHVIDPDDADPWPRHHQHFGASLAITVDAYRRVGGLPPEPFLEDEALVRALRRHDLRMRHSERVSVVTSSRRRGRVAVGLSWQLREWAARAAASEDAVVDDPAHWARVLATRRRLRELWSIRQRRLADGSAAMTPREQRALESLSSHWNVPPTWLTRAYRRVDAFGALWAEIEARMQARRGAPQAVSAVPMAHAIVTLRELIAERRAETQTKRASRTGRAGSSGGASR